MPCTAFLSSGPCPVGKRSRCLISFSRTLFNWTQSHPWYRSLESALKCRSHQLVVMWRHSITYVFLLFIIDVNVVFSWDFMARMYWKRYLWCSIIHCWLRGTVVERSTSVFDRRTFLLLRSTCSWRVAASLLPGLKYPTTLDRHMTDGRTEKDRQVATLNVPPLWAGS